MNSTSHAFRDWLRGFWPQAMLASRRDRALASLGAALGLIVTEWLCRQALGAANPWFIAPMGASAVLLFAVPASPLAQPWSIVGGNFFAALVGVSCAKCIGNPGVAAGVAAALAIGVMFPLRCLHPPSGAVALTAVLGGPAVVKLGYQFVLTPVLLNSLILAALALLFNNLLQRRYPHAAPAMPAPLPRDALPSARVGIRREDLHAVLAERGEMLDIREDDLEETLIRAELRAHQRRFGELRCADFMTRDVLTVSPDTSCRQAGDLLRQYRFDALPVVSATGVLLGMVNLYDLLPPDAGGALFSQALRQVRQVMETQVHRSHVDDAIETLIHPFSDEGIQQSAVVDDAGRLVGMVTQADLIAALFREQLER